MNVFKHLYNLALSLLTARPDSQRGQLTNHHGQTQEQAETILRAAILQRTMPGEAPTTSWGLLRIFMRNLVNRAYPPMSADEMVRILDDIAGKVRTFEQRQARLVKDLSNNPPLTASLGAFLDPQRVPDGAQSYLEWLRNRIRSYAGGSVAAIAADGVLSDLRVMAANQGTKIPNMAIALAANLFGDCGVRPVAKPDKHVLPIIKSVAGKPLTPEACIKEVIHIAQKEAPSVAASKRFDWLEGGLYPRDVDRVIYLIGSDNFFLDGNQRKGSAWSRQQLMLKVLCP